MASGEIAPPLSLPAALTIVVSPMSYDTPTYLTAMAWLSSHARHVVTDMVVSLPRRLYSNLHIVHQSRPFCFHGGSPLVSSVQHLERTLLHSTGLNVQHERVSFQSRRGSIAFLILRHIKNEVDLSHSSIVLVRSKHV